MNCARGKGAVSAGKLEARGAAGFAEMRIGWFLEVAVAAWDSLPRLTEAKSLITVRDGEGAQVKIKKGSSLAQPPLNKLSFRYVVRTSAPSPNEPGTGLPGSY